MPERNAIPQYHPTPTELDDLELLVSGALGSIDGFNRPGSPVRLTLPDDVDLPARAAGRVELVDPEGLPLAVVHWPQGDVEPLSHAEYGPFRRLYLTPAQVRERYAGRTFVPVTDALTAAQLESLRGSGPVLLLALVGTGTPELSPVALLRASLAAADLLDDAAVVAVPLASHGDPETDHALGHLVVATYAAGDPVRGLADDPDGEYPDAVATVVERDQPTPDRQGLAVFFTGLSGSGKSTLARALMDRLLEQGARTVTSLDGDVVRRHLSAGLTFSKEDRETNIRRIGWVAAEIARHGGVAVCSPIAPFDATRKQVRAYVDAAGGAFFLVHVATPLEECERRDRKGLYAKARAGQIPEFTGISSPYEEPEDADVRVDTTGRSIEECLEDVLAGLEAAGYVTGVRQTPSGGPAAGATAAADRSGRRPLKVLFVCTANICRSPVMELLARRTAPDETDIVFTSAGTHGSDGGAADEVVAAALPEGLDHAGFRSRRLTRELLEEADLVLTAEAVHRQFILDDHPGLFRKVFTLGQAAEAVRKARAEGSDLTREELLERMGRLRGAADPTLDVVDPYRRGPEAAATAVRRIGELLDVLLPALSKTKDA